MTTDENDAETAEVRPADGKPHVERINQLSGIARTSWLVMLAYLGFIGVALLAVRDADFFVATRETELPLVDIAIPTFSFFVFAPLLGAALYVYLHIHLLKLWDALAEAPATVDGAPLGEALNPWIANDFALARKVEAAPRPRPLRWFGHAATWTFVWLAGPFVVGAFWWRSMPAHAELLTTALGLAFLATLYAGWVSWRAVRDWPRAGAARPPLWRWWRRGIAALLVVAVITVGWARTEGGAERWAGRAVNLVNLVAVPDPEDRDTMGYLRRCYPEEFGPPGAKGPPLAVCFDAHGEELPRDMVQERRIRSSGFVKTDDHAGRRLMRAPLGDRVAEGWTPLAATNLAGVEMVDVPEAWRTPETARHAFRQAWCGREGVAMDVCDHPESADRPVTAPVWRDREAWCADHAIDSAADCRTHFAGLDARFETAWTEERGAALANLSRLSLAGRDLRRADAAGATLIRADLRWARLEGADLSEARLEKANLFAARLEGADLSEARLGGATLIAARLEKANLFAARLEGADLRGARLEGAELPEARLEGADLDEARLVGADLRWARLERAHLDGTGLEGANLSGAHLAGASLGDARLERAHLDGAGLEGANLKWAQLEEADLRKARLEGANLIEARLERADLFETGLEGANLNGAGLEWTDLRKARLEGADLFAARIEGADLRWARLERADLRQGLKGRT